MTNKDFKTENGKILCACGHWIGIVGTEWRHLIEEDITMGNFNHKIIRPSSSCWFCGCQTSTPAKPTTPLKEGFWVKFRMESGKGHTKIDETYVYYKYKDGYSETDRDIFDGAAYDWAGDEMDGFNMERFTYDSYIIEKPPIEWLENELKSTLAEQECLMCREKLILSELGIKID